MISLHKSANSDMSILSGIELPEDDNLESQYALRVAFQTMKERCQHLQARLAAVEEENVRLRLECGKDGSASAVRSELNSEEDEVLVLREKVEELTKQRSQLNHHIFMVAAENRQLWNRLTRLTRANKSLGNRLTKISDTLKKHPSTQPVDILAYSFKEVSCPDKTDPQKFHLSTDGGKKDQSLEEISLRLINSIMLEKSDLEQQCAEMVELQSSSDLNLQNVGFTYPEDADTDSLEQLKHHDIRLSQTKDALLSQQTRLKRIIEKIKTLKKGKPCRTCRSNASKKLCQTGTQIDLDINVKENLSGSNIPSSDNSVTEDCSNPEENDSDSSNKICPLCGVSYGKSTSFTAFHEHVLTHFNGDDFEAAH